MSTVGKDVGADVAGDSLVHVLETEDVLGETDRTGEELDESAELAKLEFARVLLINTRNGLDVVSQEGSTGREVSERWGLTRRG